MKIRITEDKLKVLLEAYKGEITFFSFFTNVKNFIQKLLENPTNGEPSQELKDYLGTENTKEVIEKLVDYDIIRRKCDIKETPKEATADGKSKVRFSVQYSVPKKGFKDKIHKLYDEKVVNENKKNQLHKVICETVKTIINRRGGIKENIETEYLDKYYGIPLKNYLKNSNKDDFRDNEIIYRNGTYYFPKFLEDEGYADDFDETEFEELSDAAEDWDDSLMNEILNGKYSELKHEYADFLRQHDYESLPTSEVMNYTCDVNNEWLIHFSDNAGDIWREGFKYATSDVSDLGYSGAGSITNKESEGYDFAYLASEFDRYGRSKYHRNGYKYGSEAVMFRASGVKATHFGDEEEQVMFYNKDAKDIVYLEHSDWTDEWYVGSNNGRPLYHSDNLEDVVLWVERNFDQYRKHLVNPKQHAIRRDNDKFSTYQYKYNKPKN